MVLVASTFIRQTAKLHFEIIQAITITKTAFFAFYDGNRVTVQRVIDIKYFRTTIETSIEVFHYQFVGDIIETEFNTRGGVRNIRFQGTQTF